MKQKYEDPGSKRSRQSMPRLVKWQAVSDTRVYIIGKSKLQVKGLIYNHPGYRDGQEIITSEVLWLDEDKGLVQTSNQLYELGKKQE